MAENQTQTNVAGNALLSGSFTGTGTITPVLIKEGDYTVSVSGLASSTVLLQRSFDNAVSWVTAKSYTADTEENLECRGSGILYRWNCSVYGSGTAVAIVQ